MGYIRHNIEEMKKLASSKGGVCLSDNYVNIKTKLEWLCSNKHTWNATPDNILRGKWCPKCSGHEKHSIETFQEIAAKKGGKLISTLYKNIDSNMEWECSLGHRWMATGNNVKLKNTWCSKCSGTEKIGIEKLREIAIKNGGKLLSEKYLSRTQKYKWQCKEGHVWHSSASNVYYSGNWCPTCFGNKKLSLTDLQNVAISRKGELLSDSYTNIDSIYEWKCSRGHIWKASGDKVKNQNTWCPYCSRNNFNEEIVRVYFEAIFSKDFPKRRPIWLINSEGKRMELDGYCEELKIAFEYNGIQHYKKGYFMKSDSMLEKRIGDDKQKRVLCSENNVVLFVIDYSLPEQEFRKFIIEQSKLFKIDEYVNPLAKIDLSSAYISSDHFDKLKKIVHEKNGILLENFWQGFNHKYKIKCKRHDLIFSSYGSNLVYKNKWCPKCGKESMAKTKFQSKLTELLEFAQSNNAELISNEYIGQYHTYKFLCSKGHLIEISWKERNRKKVFCKICKT